MPIKFSKLMETLKAFGSVKRIKNLPRFINRRFESFAIRVYRPKATRGVSYKMRVNIQRYKIKTQIQHDSRRAKIIRPDGLCCVWDLKRKHDCPVLLNYEL